MIRQVAEKIAELDHMLGGIGSVAVAVSGGVDSLTLAYLAHRRLGAGAVMFHAVSAAVPAEATDRTRRHAERFGWRLEVIDAGEFSDQQYVQNPVNRCFFCKNNLYGTIASQSDATILSGTNLDDLTDFRPGLQAAKRYQVRHPYVEARIDKELVRSIAKSFELNEAARLPASPCLSSRVQTGIPVTPEMLDLVHTVERLLSDRLGTGTVRCRVRREGLVVELDEPTFIRFKTAHVGGLRTQIEALGAARGFPGAVEFVPYRMGSAFLRSERSK